MTKLRYAPLDGLERTPGVQLFAGPHESRSGASKPLVYLLADWFL